MVKRLLVHILHLIILLLVTKPACSQVAGAEISVNPRSGSLDSSFQMSITLNPEIVNSKPTLVQSDSFEVYGQGTQSRTIIHNGQVKNQVNYSYTLIPTKIGELNLPLVKVTINGKEHTLNGGTITVTRNNSSSKLDNNKRVLFEQSVSDLEVFQGQQIKNRFELIADEIFRDVDFPAPAFQGFWVEDKSRDQSGTRIQNGRRVHVFQTERSLYPLGTGRLELEPKTITFQLLEKRKSSANGFFDPFSFEPFFGSGTFKKFQLESNPIEIQVKPLPANPADANFWSDNPLVGKTKVEFDVPQGNINLGEGKTITVKITTDGNANPIKQIPINNKPGDYRIYQESPRISYSQAGEKLIMIVELAASLVPEKPGDFNFPDLHFTYFDPKSEKYQTVVSPALNFKIIGEISKSSDTKPDPKPIIEPTATASATPEQEQTNDLYKEASKIEKFFYRFSPGTLVFVLISIIGVIAALFIALPIFRRNFYLSKILRRISNCDNADNLGKIFERHIQKVTAIKTAGYRRKELAKLLREYIKDSNLLFETQTLLDDLDLASYSVQKDVNLDELKSRMKNIVKIWYY